MFVVVTLMYMEFMVCFVGIVEATFLDGAVNETICCALVSGGVPVVLEPVGLCCDDGKKPDGMSLIPWLRGLPLLWDFTCCDTLAPSNLSTSSAGWQSLQS